MCKSCNETTGSEIEAGARRDDSIRFAIDALRDELPRLAEGEDYEARAPTGAVIRATLRRGKHLVRASREGNSLIQSTEDAKATIERTLRRRGKSEDEIRETLALVEQAEPGVAIHASDDMTVVHGQVERFHLALRGTRVSEAFPALVGFHALALALGGTIYAETLNGLRDAVRVGLPSSEWHTTERLLSADREYRPVHLVGLSQGEPHIVIQVRLFWMLVWRVHFLHAATSATAQALALDLVDQTAVAA